MNHANTCMKVNKGEDN